MMTESLSTLMCEVESIVNSWPIKVVSSDANDLDPLTPNHFSAVDQECEVPLPAALFASSLETGTIVPSKHFLEEVE